MLSRAGSTSPTGSGAFVPRSMTNATTAPASAIAISAQKAAW